MTYFCWYADAVGEFGCHVHVAGFAKAEARLF